MDTKRKQVGAYFVLERPNAGRYGFSFVGARRELVLRGASYSSVDEASAGIEAVRAQILVSDWPQRFQTPDETTYYFEIVYRDGTLLATSVRYASRIARELAIELVQLDAVTAPIRRDE